MFDGVGEAWCESLNVLRSLNQKPALMKTLIRLIEDEFCLIDLSWPPFGVAQEFEIF